tara:strand:+ start:667 stop:846 length:180 start_codon:yes stop_codon:yes gene_type:complete
MRKVVIFKSDLAESNGGALSWENLLHAAGIDLDLIEDHDTDQLILTLNVESATLSADVG